MPQHFGRWVATGALALGLGAGGVALFGGGAIAASSTTTLHFYSKSTTVELFNVYGQVQSKEAAGDHVVSNDLDYVGNHSHHVATWTASDHEFCTFPSLTTANCFGEFAVGGSLIYADNFSLNPTSGGTVAVSGGTGSYAGDKGTISMTSVGNSQNSDVTITLKKG